MDAFVCDAVRTPIRRYGGALSSVRADDPGGLADPGTDGAQPAGGLGAVGRGHPWLRQSGGRGQPQCRAHGRPSGRLAKGGARGDGQPVVRQRHGCRRHGRARDQGRGLRSDDGRWRGEHEPRAFCHAQGGGRVFPRQHGLRHNHRLAFCEPEDGGAIRYGVHAGNRGQCGRGLGTSRARIRMPSRPARRRVGPRRRRRGGFADELAPVTIPQRKGDPLVFDQDEHPRPEHPWKSSPGSKA